MALSRADIQRAFQNALGRAASQADENAFFAASQGGTSDAQIFQTISNGREADIVTDPVVRFYQAAFGRVPDAGGLDNWQDYIRANGPSQATYTDVATLFTQQTEFINRYGTGTTVDAAYVQALYRDILGRDASAAEVAGYVSGSAGYTGRGGVLYAISQSQEAFTRSDAAVNAFLLDAAEGDATYTGSLPGVPSTEPTQPTTPTQPTNPGGGTPPVQPNRAPIAGNDTLTAIAEDSGARVITAAELLGNDTDADGNTLRIASVTAGTGGTVELNSNGTVTFTPTADFNGTANFTYTVTDGAAASNAATASFTVTPVNDAPVARNDSYTVNEDSTLLVFPRGVLANDTDADGNALTAALVTGPANGTVTLNPGGGFTYRANENYFGTDTFTYRANDGSADSAPATVTMTVTAVNDAPVVTSGATTSVAENTTGTVYTVTATDVDNATAALTYAISGGADAGLFNINASTGAVSFKGAPNFEAPADAGGNNVYDLLVTASDGQATSAARAVAISVTDVNDVAPTFTSSATPSVAENTKAVVTLTSTDPDTVGGPSLYTITGGADAAKFQIVNGNELQFIDAPDFETPASAAGTNGYAVQVSANDGANATAQNLTVSVADVNEPVFSIVALDASKAEGNTGTTAYTFTVSRTGDITEATTLDYAVTGSGTNAASAADFGGALPGGSVSFAANQRDTTLTINVSGDTTFEQNEGFTVTLSNAPTNGTISPTLGSANGAIQNDDSTPTLAYQATFQGNTNQDGQAGNYLVTNGVEITGALANSTIDLRANGFTFATQGGGTREDGVTFSLRDVGNSLPTITGFTLTKTGFAGLDNADISVTDAGETVIVNLSGVEFAAGNTFQVDFIYA